MKRKSLDDFWGRKEKPKRAKLDDSLFRNEHFDIVVPRNHLNTDENCFHQIPIEILYHLISFVYNYESVILFFTCKFFASLLSPRVGGGGGPIWDWPRHLPSPFSHDKFAFFKDLCTYGTADMIRYFDLTSRPLKMVEKEKLAYRCVKYSNLDVFRHFVSSPLYFAKTTFLDVYIRGSIMSGDVETFKEVYNTFENSMVPEGHDLKVIAFIKVTPHYLMEILAKSGSVDVYNYIKKKGLLKKREFVRKR